MPRLVELSLARFEFDDVAVGALPITLQSLRLIGTSGTTAAGLRHLARLPRLRSLQWANLADSEIRAALAEVVKTAPIEQFFWPIAPLSEPLWQALQAQPRLRSLHLQLGADVDAVATQLVRLTRLERLSLSCASLPERAESLRLTELSQLRRLDLSTAGPMGDTRVADLARRLQELLSDRVVIKAQ
jgi:hypothetical protein